jgi:acyl carrier protein
MNSPKDHLLVTIFECINTCKKTAFAPEIIGLDAYLGGDLGIDSREMLEIWYEIEKKLGVEVHDSMKRDIYKIEDVRNVFAKVMTEQGEEVAG